MNSSLNLRAKFLLSMWVMVAILCATFSVTVHQFINLLEDEMLNQTLTREMQEFTDEFALHPDHSAPSESGLRGYIVRNERNDVVLPPQLTGLTEGLHDDVAMGGKEYYVARKDVPSARLYLALDTERVDALEDKVMTVASVSGVLALVLAILIASFLARTVMRPVTELARQVATLDPRSRDKRLSGQFADREMGIIATAFDEYVARLNQVLEREQSFTEDASHELRTPLSVIASAAQLLAEEPDLSTRCHERILRIRRACGQMQSLIEALLFLAREENAVPNLTCSLDEIVREAADTIRTIAEEKKVGLDVQVQPVLVNAPPGMVVCVVNNLLLNAINFTDHGLVEVKLTAAELLVRDTGVGIAPAELSQIFERRYRGAQSRGLGLGLYLVSRICDRLGWQIHAETAPGIGTSFRIQLQSIAVAPSLEIKQ